MCPYHKNSPPTVTTLRKPPGSDEERAPFWGKKNGNTDPFSRMFSSLKAMTAVKTSVWRAMGKRMYFSFLRNIRFPSFSNVTKWFIWKWSPFLHTRCKIPANTFSEICIKCVPLSTFLRESHYHLSATACGLSVPVLHHWHTQEYFKGEKWSMCPDSSSYLHIV